MSRCFVEFFIAICKVLQKATVLGLTSAGYFVPGFGFPNEATG
jgi:hypothetical protein